MKINRPQIEFKEVSFGYSEEEKVFKNLNLAIKPGEKIGLVGYSGAGKSSLVNLLLKYFKVSMGQILIDGQNINDISQDSLRENISVIPQDTMLFHRSILENIRYGRLDATDEEVIAASKAAHIHEFIVGLTHQYQTYVGERGVKLSGGQRQRISIARAILKDAPILILDEATSSLDSHTEKLIQDSLNFLIESKGKTVIAIAHRLSTLKHMDRILIMDKGKIIDVVRVSEMFIKQEPITIKTFSSEEITTDIHLLCALIAEIRMPLSIEIAEKKEFLKHTDLLDFPGARSREPYEVIKEGVIQNMFLRGKISYLFNKYSSNYEINNLLFCVKNQQNEVKEIPLLINDWIKFNVGNTSEERQRRIGSNGSNPLFIILTFYNSTLEF
ncbi:MAG: ATP-binding cassette domain-containing protein, partial [Alphaproteobacteria bacterium]|nr:ATP-binding cassette domain-containing protein [Alphaproteobacteria bacterium]